MFVFYDVVCCVELLEDVYEFWWIECDDLMCCYLVMLLLLEDCVLFEGLFIVLYDL